MRKTESILKSQKRSWLIRLRTKHPDADNFDAIVLANHKKHILLAVEDSFEFGSLVALPKKWITSCRDGKYEKCQNQIIRTNNQLGKFKSPDWLIEASSVEIILIQMQKRNIWPVIETIDQIVGPEASSLYIGPILEVTKHGVVIDFYDAAGKWEKAYSLPLTDIFKIEFKDRYSKHFNSYMKKHTKNR